MYTCIYKNGETRHASSNILTFSFFFFRSIACSYIYVHMYVCMHACIYIQMKRLKMLLLVYYRVAKTHTMPDLYRSFSTQVNYI